MSRDVLEAFAEVAFRDHFDPTVPMVGRAHRERRKLSAAARKRKNWRAWSERARRGELPPPSQQRSPMRSPKLDPITRFWNLVARGEANACWPWMGAVLMRRGKILGGSFSAPAERWRPNGRRTHTVLAQRWAWRLAHGVLPAFPITQTCGEKRCCNPAHLVRVGPRGLP